VLQRHSSICTRIPPQRRINIFLKEFEREKTEKQKNCLLLGRIFDYISE
jgi:hypothetical protein